MELSPVLRQRFFDSDGLPLAGGKVYSYLAGTSTPTPTYTDQGGGTPNANPVILDASGYAFIWLNPSTAYKFIVKNASDVLQFTVDNVMGSALNANSVSSFNITEGQSSAALTGETWDSQSVKSVEYLAEVRRGTQLVNNIRFVVQWKSDAAAWAVFIGEEIGDGKQHGLTLSVTTTTTVGQLFVAVATDGYGNGTLKLKKVVSYAS